MVKFIVTITVFSIKALTREAKLRQVSITSYFTSAVIGASLSKVVTWYVQPFWRIYVASTECHLLVVLKRYVRPIAKVYVANMECHLLIGSA